MTFIFFLGLFEVSFHQYFLGCLNFLNSLMLCFYRAECPNNLTIIAAFYGVCAVVWCGGFFFIFIWLCNTGFLSVLLVFLVVLKVRPADNYMLLSFCSLDFWQVKATSESLYPLYTVTPVCISLWGLISTIEIYNWLKSLVPKAELSFGS